MSQEKPLHYGLNNCYYALKTTNGYATPVRMRGAVSLTLDAEGDTNTFYADNGAYFVTTTNNGRSGSIELAGLNDQALVDLLGYEIDDNGVVMEMADKNPKEFALLFDTENDSDDPTKFIMYNVKLERSTNEHSTMEESAEPKTQTFNLKAIPAEFTLGGKTRKVVGGHIDKTTETAETYAGWYTAVVTPSVAAA